EPRGQELIDRYKRNYNIPAGADVKEEMILAHWELEKRLAKQLLESDREKRWVTFERCYSALYGELKWLNQLINTVTTISPSELYSEWIQLIGQPPQKVYEVGSGKGEMIAYLASCGFECRATEITRERGQRHATENHSLSWGLSDGIHLDKFETPDSYDAVISNQVIEHLHPDDLYDHFKGVLSILIDGGRYIFCSPHRFLGPSDISAVFKQDKLLGMHLKEYTYRELAELLSRAGFKEIYAVLIIPSKVKKVFGGAVKPRASNFYLGYLKFLETLISTLPRQALRRKAAKLSRLILFATGIFMAARKGYREKL
ncbi:MAG: class I SAM-dependent methyltransferase, partial [Candidatus Krumholzibacteria bacterium]|nr:class I SAM-dependent methyltransferase [Candidatus Krumholzibacteria bacterium]